MSATVLLALGAMAAPARADAQRECRHRIEYSAGAGMWGFRSGPGDNDLEGFGFELSVLTAPRCGAWMVGGRGSANGELQLNLFGTQEKQQPLGLFELGPTTGVALRGNRAGLTALIGPALTLVRPNRQDAVLTVGASASLSLSVRLSNKIWAGPQVSTNINATRSATAFYFRLEGVVSR